MKDDNPYMFGTDRDDLVFTSFNMLVDEDELPRVVDKFVNTVIKGSVEFKYSQRENVGRKSYDPYMMLTLLIVGYIEGIRSCRRLAKFAARDDWGKWICQGLTPNFRTINDFRLNNIDVISEVLVKFIEFFKVDVAKATGKNVFGGYFSVDGTKIRAQQSKDGCFTASKIDDRIKNDKEKIADIKEQLSQPSWDIDCNDEEVRVSKDKLEKSLASYEKRQEKHEQIKKEIEQSGEQYSENDPDSRLMKNHYGGYTPAYNVQTAVDSESHMISAVLTTNNCTDHGLIKPTVDQMKRDEDEIIEIVADNGYAQPADMVDSLENAIIPNTFLSKVAKSNGVKVYKNEIELGFKYEPNTITDEEKASSNIEDIKKCLRAGVCPDCYKDYLRPVVDEQGQIKIVTKTTREFETLDDYNIDMMSEEEKQAKAMEGYFVRDIEANKVFCPAGYILRKKSIKDKGIIRYSNKLACKNCPFKEKCFTATKVTKWKEIDFGPGVRIKPAKFRTDGNDGPIAPLNKPTRMVKAKKATTKVYFIFHPDRQKLNNRKCLSEHPFGTIKRYMNGGHFLLKGLRKTNAEANLFAIGYNFKRAISLFSARELLAVMGI